MSDLPLFITPKKAGCLLAILLVGTPAVHARVLVPGESATVTNPPAPEAWAVSQGGTLTINSANALTIRSENANVVFNGGQSERIEAREGSNVAMSGATVTSSTGRGGSPLATALPLSMPAPLPALTAWACCWGATSILRPPPVPRLLAEAPLAVLSAVQMPWASAS